MDFEIDDAPICSHCGRYEDEHSEEQTSACKAGLKAHKEKLENGLADLKTKIGHKGLPYRPR